jgi:hypothetical protein
MTTSTGFQSIINLAETLDINRRRVMGIQYTRSEVAKINETVTRNPWRFTLTVPGMLPYDQIRDLLEDIDRLDRRTPQVISFSTSTGASSGLSYMFAYQGDMTDSQVSGITIQSWSGNQMTLTNLPQMISTKYLFRKGDFIQAVGYPYPVTIQYDVPRGTSSTVVVTTHRPAFGGLSTATVNRNILVGNNVEFNMFCNNTPTYKLNPGGSTALVTWDGPFTFYEFTGDI